MNNAVAMVISRLKEPSSHAALAALVQVLSFLMPQYATVFNTLTVVFGALGFGLPETAKATA